jgi:hypothetical protein
MVYERLFFLIISTHLKTKKNQNIIKSNMNNKMRRSLHFTIFTHTNPPSFAFSAPPFTLLNVTCRKAIITPYHLKLLIMSINLTPSLLKQVNAGKKRPCDPSKWSSQEPKTLKDSGQGYVGRISGKENNPKPPPSEVRSFIQTNFII